MTPLCDMTLWHPDLWCVTFVMWHFSTLLPCVVSPKEKEKKRNINNDLAILPSHDTLVGLRVTCLWGQVLAFLIVSTSAVSLAMDSMISLYLACCISWKSAFTVWNICSVSYNVIWSQCTGELGVLLRALASVRASLRSFLNLPICWIKSEPGVVELENRKLGMLGVSSVSELSSSVWRFSALEVGQIFLAVVCTLFILDPGLLGPGIWVPGLGQPSPALIAFIFYFVVLFICRLVGCSWWCDREEGIMTWWNCWSICTWFMSDNFSYYINWFWRFGSVLLFDKVRESHLHHECPVTHQNRKSRSHAILTTSSSVFIC